MRKLILALLVAVISFGTQAAEPVEAIFSVNPKMSCNNCEKKIKGNLRFEKGVKNVETSLENQTVTVKYDPDKTNEANLAKAFSKIGYEASTEKKDCAGKQTCTGSSCKSESKTRCQKEAKSSCQKEESKSCCKKE